MPQKDEKPSKNGELDKTVQPDLREIKALYDLMVNEGLDFLELKEDDVRVRLSREAPMTAAAATIAPRRSAASSKSSEEALSATPPVSEHPSVNSPLAGLFYRASSPSAAPFVKEGDVVEPGQTLCIIEAMKVMNEIKAESGGRILKILVENARSVTAGQALFHVSAA